MQTYKPGSVSPTEVEDPYHLSSPAITSGINQPTRSVIPIAIGTMDEQSMSTMAENETYLVFQHARFTLPLMSPPER